MNSSDLTLYKRLKNKPPYSLSHSKLFCLEPIGVGTPFVEGLTSYVTRLASAHCISVNTLLLREVIPLISIGWLRETGRNQIQRDMMSVNWFRLVRARLNGVSESAREWVTTLETLTLRTDLRHLTFLAWKNVIGHRGLLRHVRAWCPPCYEGWRLTGKIVYDPLLWSAASVRICPIHKRQLEQCCPHCGAENPPITSQSLSGCCSVCGGWLGIDYKLEQQNQLRADEVPPYDLWVANSIGRLLEGPASMSSRPSPDCVVRSIEACIEREADGNKLALCRILNIHKCTLLSWRKGVYLPDIAQSLKLSYAARLTLFDFLAGNVGNDNLLPLSKSTKELRVSNPITRHRKDKVIMVLEAALLESPTPSIKELTARLGYKRPCPLYNFSTELCKKISAKHRLEAPIHKQQRQHVKHASGVLTTERVLESALSEDPVPSVRQVALRLGYEDSRTMIRSHSDLCTKLKEKHLQQKKMKKEWLQTNLQQVLNEEPPPSLECVTQRLGFKQPICIRCIFPDLCQKISGRYQKHMKRYRADQEERIRVKLSELLHVNPPVSSEKAAKQVGYSRTYLGRKFNLLLKKIGQRYSKYLRDRTAKQREMTREEIRRAAIELTACNIYPTRSKIRELCPPEFIRRGHWYFQEVAREVRKELGWR